jgi:hypothetical protein
MPNLIDIWDDAINDLSEDTTPDIDADFVGARDTSATAPKKVLLKNLVGSVLAVLRTAFTPASSSAAASLAFHEDTDNGTNKITLQGQPSVSSDKTVSLPDETCELGFRNIPQNSQSAAYTTVLADAAKHILHPAADANARTFTIDSNANVPYPIGTAITFVNETSQVVTIAITSDTLTLAGTTTTGSRSLAQNGIATALKVGSTAWIISGTGLS